VTPGSRGGATKLACLIVTAALVASWTAAAQDVPSLVKRYDCYRCHADKEAKRGPAFAAVAAKYRGNPNATAIATGVVKKGRHGSGPWPMPPLTQVPNADARKIATYILSLEE